MIQSAYACPKCGATLQGYPASEEISVGCYLAFELLGWSVFALVLWALWAYEVALIVAILAFLAAVIAVAWRLYARHRAREAVNPSRYSCPKCLRVFGARQLESRALSGHNHAL